MYPKIPVLLLVINQYYKFSIIIRMNATHIDLVVVHYDFGSYRLHSGSYQLQGGSY